MPAFTLREKCPYSELSGPYFATFGHDMEIFPVNFLIQSKCVNIQTRKNPNMDTFYTVLVIKLFYFQNWKMTENKRKKTIEVKLFVFLFQSLIFLRS